MKRKPLGAIGAVSLAIVLFMAITADVIAPYDPVVQDIPSRLQAPSLTHWLGTDEFGRDEWSRILFGARISLYVGIMSSIIGAVGGTILGIFSAYAGGKTDLIIQRFVDTMIGFPSLILAMVLVATLGASLNNVVIAISAGFLPRLSRVARSQALSIKEQEFILAAQSIGAADTRILFLHMVPNCIAPVIVLTTAFLGTAIVTEASLSFLGLGVPPPAPSWGGMLNWEMRRFMEEAPYLVLAPGLALTLAVFGFNLFGDALRDVLDPRLRGGR